MNTEDTLLKIKELVSKIETEIKQDKISNDEKLNQAKELITSVISEVENPFTTYQIPGVKLDHEFYDHSMIKNIPDPNILLKESVRIEIDKMIPILEKYYTGKELIELSCKLNEYFIGNTNSNNLIEKHCEGLYNTYNKSGGKEQLLQPTVGALRDHENIYTIIYFFENYKKEITKKDFEVYQNYTIGADGRPQLVYYVCFNITEADKNKGETYRMHKFSVKNSDMECICFNSNSYPKKKHAKLNIEKIEEVIAFVVDVDPESSRGTTTTVKDASGN